VAARLFNPLLLLLARLTDPQLARAVRFLKVENAILRSRLPKRVDLTQTERNRLFKLGRSLGSAIKELIAGSSNKGGGNRTRSPPYC
jgi:putative transposase